MTTNIAGYQLETGYPLSTAFNDVAGVYAIYTNERWLDVGETDQLGTRISGHERRSCWQRNANSQTIYVAIYREANQQIRLHIESYLRLQLNPMCGDK
ncbi:MAG: hypothetical protein G01um101416_512 [Microgenomates group bacterium Gr01-1014_16]|nr:MAG: hypothetical protein G01um101416_512 [Microgenomates group bacterium Gr01-1014_16]